MKITIAVAAFIFAFLASTGLAETTDKALERLMPAAGENGRQRFAKALAICQAYTSTQRSLGVISEDRKAERLLEIFLRRSRFSIEYWAYFPYVPDATAAIKEILATEIRQNWPIRPEAVDFFEQRCHLALYRTEEQVADFIAKSAADLQDTGSLVKTRIPSTDPESIAQTEAKIEIEQILIDPESANYKFDKTECVVFEDYKRCIVCGQVNSKNSLGGYVGFKKFLYRLGSLTLEGTGGYNDDLYRVFCR